MQVYELALQNDPQIREADANRLASREAKPQAWAALLPQVNGSFDVTKRDASSESTNPVFSAGQGVKQADPQQNFRSSDATTRAYNVELRQTLFRWDQWVALKRADSQVAQAEAAFGAAAQDLIQRTAQRYFDVLAAKDTVDASEASLDAFSRQLEQAEKRFEVGLIAITDVQEARAAHDSAAAGVIAARRTLSTNQELLRELTGEPIGSLAAPIADLPLRAPDATQEDWVARALQQNPRVISARLATEIAKQDINSARTRHLPSVDLVVRNSNSIDSGDSSTRNTGSPRLDFPADGESDSATVGIQVSIPIFTGGGTSSVVRQRVQLHRASREQLERANRETERATRDAYLGVISEMSRVKSLRQALESSQTALKATEAGFEVGTRTTVDVLDSRRRLFDAQTNYSRSRYDYLLNVLRLQQATGSLTQADLERINANLEK
jgi:outer membrane protein